MFGFHVGEEIGDGFFHDAGAFNDLGQEHFTGTEEVADDAHAVHEGAFDDVEGAGVFLAGFFDVFFNVVDDAFDEGVCEAFFDVFVAPGFGVGFGFLGAAVFDGFGEVDQFFGGFGVAVEDDVFDELKKFGLNFVIDFEHAGVDDAHVEAGVFGVV